MRLGACCDPARTEALEAEGYDYIELPLSRFALMEESDFLREAAGIRASQLPPYAFNLFVPGRMRLTGPDVDEDGISRYLQAALGRAGGLGGKIVVFGSGGARRVPEGFDRRKAWDQLVRFLSMAGEIAASHGVTVAVEPLRSAETNIINTAAEGLRMARTVGHANVRLLVDYYHMASEGESPDIVVEAGAEFIRHVHVANPDGRKWPRDAGESDYRAFLANLSRIGYDGGVSIEAQAGPDFRADIRSGLACMKAVLESLKGSP